MPPSSPCELRVIEPNLAGNSGHYAEFVGAVAARSAGTFGRIHVYAAKRAAGVLTDQPLVRMHAVFGERGTQRQEERLIRDALQSGDPFLVLTAQAAHAPLLGWLAWGKGRSNLENARLYFHWRERSLAHRALMALAPRVRARAVAIAPTEPTADFLRARGWKRVARVPYPMLAPQSIPPVQPFRHLLVAGAARLNKGLDLVAGLAEQLAGRDDPMPLLVQTTPKRKSGRRGTKEEAQLARLAGSGARGLQCSDEAPNTADYGARFAGALVLAPYDPEHFADNVSGVVLDALLRGAPVIASADSWPGRMVERFQAGALLHERTPQALDAAVQQVLRDWTAVCGRTQIAARALAAEHDPAQLVRVLRDGV
ncbi:MAG: hypothetical protein JNK53_07245 [Phycisphaerae bacterium]|nr:hypothetical protein [Phycisphaerae bacterium]